jgi:hypothetical protein
MLGDGARSLDARIDSRPRHGQRRQRRLGMDRAVSLNPQRCQRSVRLGIKVERVLAETFGPAREQSVERRFSGGELAFRDRIGFGRGRQHVPHARKESDLHEMVCGDDGQLRKRTMARQGFPLLLRQFVFDQPTSAKVGFRLGIEVEPPDGGGNDGPACHDGKPVCSAVKTPASRQSRRLPTT